MTLTLEQKDRIRDWLYESDIAFLVEWIMYNTYDSRLEDLANHVTEREKPFSNAIRMRDDLAEEGLSVPASKSFTDYDTQVDVVYITAEELQGATYGDDPAHPDEHPFCYVELKDGRSLYFLSVDLDFGETA